MKRILLSLGTIALVGAAVVGGTGAFFQDTETSQNNIFVAGAIDLKVDHTYAEYNGETCVGDCEPVGPELVVNGGFELPELNNGQWDVFDSIPGWEAVSGAGIEIQNNAAGAPHGGEQLVELDSHGAGSQSGMEQVIPTIPGQGYLLSFWHSPRPNNGPDTDNAIEFTVEITSTSGTIISDTVGQPSFSGSGTVWTRYDYLFVAQDDETTIRFVDAGSQADTLGGYVDDVSVRELSCSTNPSYPHGGVCTLWNARDLGGSEFFWNFPDIKPGDWGKNLISLHVIDNDSFVCLLPGNIEDDENTVVDPEVTAGDGPLDGVPNGELSGELEFFLWEDDNGNTAYDVGEAVVVPAGTPFNQIETEMVAMSLVGDAPLDFVGLEWCAGTQSGPQNTGDTDAITCDGNGMGNIAQTDKMIADFVAYAVQQRNNSEFQCSDVDLGGDQTPIDPT